MYRNYPKYILFSLLAILLVVMPLLSLDAGISGDEEVHMKQAEFVIDYFKSLGTDKAAVQTPVTNLKYYGQSFDNLTTLLGQIFRVTDIYTFRHICNSLAGWLCILFSALIAIRLRGYGTAIFVVLLLIASPRFTGHSFNNLKDIPFALGYIASIYFMLNIFSNIKEITRKDYIGLIISMAFIFSIRPGGLLVFCYFILFSGIYLFRLKLKEKLDFRALFPYVKNLIFILTVSYFIGILFWPYALENPIINPIKSLKIMSHYPVTLRQVFEGKVYWSDQLPWYYLLKYIVLTIPIIILPLLCSYLIKIVKDKNSFQKIIENAFLLFTVVFPLFYAITRQSNVYGAWRHLLFIYPVIVVTSAIGLSSLLNLIQNKVFKVSIVFTFLACLYPSLAFSIKNYPIQYTYFNSFAGEYKTVAKNYELDYYYHSVKKASSWLIKHLKAKNTNNITIASNYGIDEYFKECDLNIKFKYVPYYQRGNADWDYGVFYRAYISPSQTSNKLWPPVETINTIDIENIPVSVIVKRQTKKDYSGKLAYEAGDYQQAILLLRQAVQIDPVNEIAWINLGKSYLKLKQYNYALTTFEQCLNLVNNYEPALYYLANTSIKLGNSERAKGYYKEILKHNNKSYQTYLAFAKLEFDLQNFDAALNLTEKCLQWNPSNKEAKELKYKILKNK